MSIKIARVGRPGESLGIAEFRDGLAWPGAVKGDPRRRDDGSRPLLMLLRSRKPLGVNDKEQTRRKEPPVN